MIHMTESGRAHALALCIILSVLIAVAAILSPVFSSLMNSVVIGNTGNISMKTITARSGSIDDLQAAINSVHAQGSGTVYIPAGIFTFNPNGTKTSGDGFVTGVESFGGINIIGAGADKTILRETVNPPSNGGAGVSMIVITGNNGFPFRISGIKFQGYVNKIDESANAIGLSITGATDFRVDNCWFDSFDGQAITTVDAGASGDNRGVIDHSNFTETYKQGTPPTGGWVWAYGIIVWDLDTGAWSSDASIIGQYYGTHDVVYIENCWFNATRHAVSNSQNGYYVLRYSNITNEVPNNFGSIDVHGFNGGRGCEAYNNTVTATSGYSAGQAVWLRGGTNTVFNNTFVNEEYGVQLFYETGWTPTDAVNNTYIWGNTMQGGGTAFIDHGGYTAGVNYTLSARPNYTPFTYPHPLTLQGTP